MYTTTHIHFIFIIVQVAAIWLDKYTARGTIIVISASKKAGNEVAPSRDEIQKYDAIFEYQFETNSDNDSKHSTRGHVIEELGCLDR